MKKQRGNAFHRGWPQAKESYLAALFLLVDRKCGVSAPQSLSKLWLVQISQCYVTML